MLMLLTLPDRAAAPTATVAAPAKSLFSKKNKKSLGEFCSH